MVGLLNAWVEALVILPVSGLRLLTCLIEWPVLQIV